MWHNVLGLYLDDYSCYIWLMFVMSSVKITSETHDYICVDLGLKLVV